MKRSFDRIKTKHEYHDAWVTRVEWSKADEFRVTLDLCIRHDPGTPIPGYLTFSGVRNRAEIEAQLLKIAEERGHDKYIVNVSGFVRESHDVFVLAANPGSIRIRCQSFFEA